MVRVEQAGAGGIPMLPYPAVQKLTEGGPDPQGSQSHASFAEGGLPKDSGANRMPRAHFSLHVSLFNRSRHCFKTLGFERHQRFVETGHAPVAIRVLHHIDLRRASD